MYRSLWFKCKLLKKRNEIHSFWSSNGTIKIRIEENGRVKSILHEDDLQDIFPKIEIASLK